MTVLLTFGDPSYEPSLRRIEKEAAASGFFDEVRIRRPSDLGRAFWKKHGQFVNRHQVGYGYWIWKPWLILAELEASHQEEVIVYADAGCTINAKGRKRLDDYIELVKESPVGSHGLPAPV